MEIEARGKRLHDNYDCNSLKFTAFLSTMFDYILCRALNFPNLNVILFSQIEREVFNDTMSITGW